MLRVLRISLLSIALILFNSSVSAAVFQLNFEGLNNQEDVLQFYNGGTGGAGSSGINYGVSFSSGTLALIDSDAGGGGDFANEPSPNTIIFWQSGSSVVMNVAAGFNTGFATYYSSSAPVTVTVYDGLNGTGNILGAASGPAQYADNNCIGDPSGAFCNWSPLGVSFSGTAKSVVFTGTASNTGYDNITFGNPTPVIALAPVPTLSEWGVTVLSALLALGAILALRRQRR